MAELRLLGMEPESIPGLRPTTEHYRAVLEGDVESPDFSSKEAEVARTREVIDAGAFRGEARRATGLGPQGPDQTGPGCSRFGLNSHFKVGVQAESGASGPCLIG